MTGEHKDGETSPGNTPGIVGVDRQVRPCSHCRMTVEGYSFGSLRHYGTHTAHREEECLRLLHAKIERLRADLWSCRGTVKTELNHYERLAMVHGRTQLAESYEAEAQRLSRLLDRIDALGPNV